MLRGSCTGRAIHRHSPELGGFSLLRSYLRTFDWTGPRSGRADVVQTDTTDADRDAHTEVDQRARPSPATGASSAVSFEDARWAARARPALSKMRTSFR